MLPFWNFFLGFFLLHFSLYNGSFLHEFYLLICHESVLLSVKFFSFLLEDFSADCFMFLDAVRVELSSTSLSAHDQLRGIVLNDIDPVLSVNFLDGFVFEVVSSSSFVGHSVIIIIFVGWLFIGRLWRLMLTRVTVVISVFESWLFILFLV